MSVDLPDPFWPTRACTSPAATVIETSDSAACPGNVFERCSMRSTSANGAPLGHSAPNISNL